ncbi:beta strand repeat-containing protein, partial [Zavarzinella formosa]|uniref:beta strand repeat-containing protein n=1 Tax=Zavarzinella formosa TaxID=360055 RepID=UPI00187DAD4B
MNDASIVRRMKKWVAGGHSHRRPSPVWLALRELDDRVTPAAVTSVVASGTGISGGAGDLRAGLTAKFAVNFDSNIILSNANGLPSLTLNNGGTATFTGLSGTKGLSFSYVVTPGQDTPDLTVAAFHFNGAAITDSHTGTTVDVGKAVANPAGILKIDTTNPSVSLSLLAAGQQAPGALVKYAVAFSEPVSGVVVKSFHLTTTDKAAGTVTSVVRGADAAHYTVSVKSGAGAGNMSLGFLGHNIKDLAGNGMAARSFAEAPGSPISVGGKPKGMLLTDLNGDGRPDLVAANYGDNNVSVLLGTAAGSFKDTALPVVGTGPFFVAAGDVNGDGKPDLVTANYYSNTVTVLLGNGGGSFAAPATFDTGTGPESVVIGDVNGDGRPDLVTANYYDNTVSVLLGNGNGSFGSAAPFSVGERPESVVIGDVNRDGKPDLVTANSADNTASVLLGNGNGSFGPAAPFNTGTGPAAVVIGDVNGDGKPDLVTANNSNDTVSVLLGNGDGSFGLAAPFNTGAQPYSVTIADMNGDGKPDLVTANAADNTVSVLSGNGAGSFAEAPGSPFAVGKNPASVAVGDVNSDGTPDIVTANVSSNDVTILSGIGDATSPAYLMLSPSVVTSVVVSGPGITAGKGLASVGQKITLTLNFSVPALVDLTHGSPTLRLNNGGEAAYVGGSGTKALAFEYTVAATQDTSDLAVSSVSLNGGTIPDASLGGAAVNPAGILRIDATAPQASVMLTGGESHLAGLVLNYAVTFSEPVSGVSDDDFNLNTTDGATGTILGVIPGADAAHYTVRVKAGSDLGGIGLGFSGNAYSTIRDLAGNLPVNALFEAAGSPITIGEAPARSPNFSELVDVNGDGRPDIISDNFTSGNVSVLLEGADGSFRNAPGSPFSVGEIPVSTAVGDLNGDGKPDLVIGSSTNQQQADGYVSVLLGNGDGSFGTAVRYASGTIPFAVAIGDMNTDGKPDILVADAAAGDVLVLTGDSAGSFSLADSVPVGKQPESLTIADFNNDGKPDFAAGDAGARDGSGSTVVVAFGAGDGTFPTGASIQSADILQFVTAADVNGDGKPDLLINRYIGNAVSVLLSKGDGTFTSAPGSPVQVGGHQPYSTTVGDVNGDGKPDLVVASVGADNIANSDVRVFLGNGTGAFSSVAAAVYHTGDGPVSVSLGDVNKDGKPDLLVSTKAGGLDLLLGAGDGTFAEAPGHPIKANSNPNSVALADVNGDGKPDLVTVNYGDDTVSVLPGTGNGAFGAAANFPVGVQPASVKVGDVNGDGKPDLVTANAGDNTVCVLLGNGVGSFGAAASFGVGSEPYSVALGDVNGDGKPDLVTANVGDNTVSVLLGNGAGSFGAAASFPVGVKPASVALADVNGDGRLDLVTANYGGNNVSVLLGHGNGSFGLAASFSVGAKPISVAVGDVNGDGKPDLVVANPGDGSISVLLGDGIGSFTAGNSLELGKALFAVAINDLNGDGKPDLVATSISDNSIDVLLGNGDGSFGEAGSFATGDGPTSVAVGDVNGDGKPDLVTANRNGNNVTVLLNHTVVEGLAARLFVVNDGPGSDVNMQTSTTIAANWSPFPDDGNGVASYQWAIGTSPGGTDMQDFTDVGLATNAANAALPLTAGQTYYVTVRAVDSLGKHGLAASSNGVTYVGPGNFLTGNTGT